MQHADAAAVQPSSHEQIAQAILSSNHLLNSFAMLNTQALLNSGALLSTAANAMAWGGPGPPAADGSTPMLNEAWQTCTDGSLSLLLASNNNLLATLAAGISSSGEHAVAAAGGPAHGGTELYCIKEHGGDDAHVPQGLEGAFDLSTRHAGAGACITPHQAMGNAGVNPAVHRSFFEGHGSSRSGHGFAAAPAGPDEASGGTPSPSPFAAYSSPTEELRRGNAAAAAAAAATSQGRLQPHLESMSDTSSIAEELRAHAAAALACAPDPLHLYRSSSAPVDVRVASLINGSMCSGTQDVGSGTGEATPPHGRRLGPVTSARACGTGMGNGHADGAGPAMLQDSKAVPQSHFAVDGSTTPAADMDSITTSAAAQGDAPRLATAAATAAAPALLLLTGSAQAAAADGSLPMQRHRSMGLPPALGLRLGSGLGTMLGSKGALAAATAVAGGPGGERYSRLGLLGLRGGARLGRTEHGPHGHVVSVTSPFAELSQT